MTVKIGINGFGRIGRNTFRILQENHGLQVAAINDLTDCKTLAHLLKYDSMYGKFSGRVEAGEDSLTVNGQKIKVFNESLPENLPWGELGIDLVIEATGKFRTYEKAARHLKGGAKKVIVTAPVNDADLIVVLGVNEKKYKPAEHHIISNASCTTNALAPVVKVLHENFGIKKGLMNTTHAYTNDQRLLDLPHPDLRRARAAQVSIIPTSTGAASIIGKIIPELDGMIDGFAVRGHIPTVSMVDFVAVLERDVTAETVNKAMAEAAESPDLSGILNYSEEPLVSVDYKQSPFSCIVDGPLTQVTGSNLVRVVAWYDNEWGYSNRVADITEYVYKKGI